MSLIEEARVHLRQLAPHVKQRDTGRLMERLVDALVAAEKHIAELESQDTVPRTRFNAIEAELQFETLNRKAIQQNAHAEITRLAAELAATQTALRATAAYKFTEDVKAKDMRIADLERQLANAKAADPASALVATWVANGDAKYVAADPEDV